MSKPRRPNNHLRERFRISREHGDLTASASPNLMVADRHMVIERVQVICEAGLAEHAGNYFLLNVNIQRPGGSYLDAYSWSTETGEEGPIVANAVQSLDVVQEGRNSAEAGSILRMSYVRFGTATLPAGRVIIEGYYL